MINKCRKCGTKIDHNAPQANGYECSNCLQAMNHNSQSGIYNSINTPKYFDRGVVQLEIPEPLKGTKNDQEKPDLSLIPTEAIFEMAKALTFGSKKYSRYNFREGMDISRPIAASLRHTYQFLDGQDIDEETQCINLGNAMAGLAMAIWLLKNKPECDNRYKVDKIKK